jgi:EAL domain-containing protein (putative c-di-GMP-specific phosphodiesterase class I)
MRLWLLSPRGGKRASDRRPKRVARVRRDRALAKAIADDAIDVRFQPQIDVETGEVVAVEALARWDGATSAEALFARAEGAQLAERLSRTVQRKALRAAGQWDGALGQLRVAINLLAADLVRPGYERWLLGEIAAAGLEPCRVTVEITEGTLLADMDAAARCLAKLRAAGVRIAVDDFGTGYASLAYLTSLPLDTLKIDRGLIAHLVGGTRDQIVVKALLALARELHLQVVVEGVETLGQLALLTEWQCDFYQGFLGSGALDEAALLRFVELTAERNARAAVPAMVRA